MLVLTRKLNETILIQGDIKVTVLNIKGKTVKLGIEAPEDTQIDREECVENGKPVIARRH